ncbi:hypothetical protein E2C01_001469 [Portunus trituberculatus]|uniref:Uncharacterized protein n=1 Tax=Portunus trituberculatus TaxID=210409 RepID=A0A5B7CJH5_PORTR|nr:hypothetical protein [Portunus trituberculatus]
MTRIHATRRGGRIYILWHIRGGGPASRWPAARTAQWEGAERKEMPRRQAASSIRRRHSSQSSSSNLTLLQCEI